MGNFLEIHDTRDVSTNPHAWTVQGQLFENRADMTGTDILAGFDDIDDALAFVKATLAE